MGWGTHPNFFGAYSKLIWAKGFSDRKLCCHHKLFTFLSSPEPLDQIQPNSAKALLGKGDLSLFKWMGTPFPSGDDNQIVIIHWWNWKLFFSRTTGQISTKLGRKHSWEKGIQVFANKGLFSFSNRTLNQCYGIIKPLCRCVYWFELFLRWVMGPMGLLFTNSYSLKYIDKLLKPSSPEHSSQFQPNLAQSILVLTVQ